MSLGYIGMCKKESEDEEMVIYSYSGENWNDGENSKSGDSLLYDGSFIIYKDCLEEPEIHTKLLRMPSGRKKLLQKRITHVADIIKHLNNKRIVVEKECKNAFRQAASMPVDYIAYMLLPDILKKYQTEVFLPDEDSFIQ